MKPTNSQAPSEASPIVPKTPPEEKDVAVMREDGRSVRAVEWYEVVSREVKVEEGAEGHCGEVVKKPLVELVNTRSPHFDPVQYMEKHVIVAHKLHYSVPETYADIPAVIRYDNEDNSLRVFNISKGDFDIQEINRPKKLKYLDTVIKLDEVYGFVYGSISSRFWMMRLAMN